MDIKLEYSKKELKIIFSEKDKIISTYLLYLIIENSFAKDPNWEIYLNDNKISDSFESLKKLLETNFNNINSYKILYSDTEEGENAYKIGKNVLWFPITKWKTNMYYFNKELKRWKNV